LKPSLGAGPVGTGVAAVTVGAGVAVTVGARVGAGVLLGDTVGAGEDLAVPPPRISPPSWVPSAVPSVSPRRTLSWMKRETVGARTVHMPPVLL
jgi:hypothetical protein